MLIILITEFSKWLNKYSTVELMHRYDFAEYQINLLLKNEADGYIIREDENTFTAIYEYTYTIAARHSTDNKPHIFRFDAKVIGAKCNLTENDYEIKDYMVVEYIIK